MVYEVKNFTFLLFLNLLTLFFGQNEQGLSFESTSYDFGTISSKSKALAKFSFTNTSDLSVKILSKRGVNTCIEIDSSGMRRYEPKQKGVIKVTYDISCKGPTPKTLSVFTSSKNNSISFEFSGKIED